MATLLGGSGSGGRLGRPQTDLSGRLDPLTLATFRWRIVSNHYDSPAVLDALACRLVTDVVAPESFGDVEWGKPRG